MQIELALSTHEIDDTPDCTHPDLPAARTFALGSALAEMRTATTPDAHAAAVDAALHAASPCLRRVATHFAASWPTDIDVDDLLQEALIEVAASLHLAPRGQTHVLAAWLSSLAFDTLHGLWDAARKDARRVRATTRSWSAARANVDSDEAVLLAMSVGARAPQPSRHQPAMTMLFHVLEALPPSHAQIIALRRSGHSWRAIGAELGVSTRTAQRRGVRALAAARALASRFASEAMISAEDSELVDASQGGAPSVPQDAANTKSDRRAA